MKHTDIGFLHPGSMGISIAASAQASGIEAHWVSHNRSSATRDRAEKYRLSEFSSIEEMCLRCSMIVSVCPPHAAGDVVSKIIEQNFSGLFVDANAISPMKSIEIGKRLNDAGVDYVDGGIIGGPAWSQDSTVLYLAGKRALEVSACFSSGKLATKVIGEEIGRASALKMCYAAYSKGTMAMLTAIVGAAEKLGVRQELESQWDMDEPGFVEQTHARMSRVTAKAWRFAGEMDEIASTFEQVDYPSGFHRAAGEVYQRMSGLKGAPELPTLDQVLDVLSADTDSAEDAI
jgi:3-hydroxyisobutyrate dehydrogenase-like beta-hydroxyacid dehydrogenase